jgi:hypothetical protein
LGDCGYLLLFGGEKELEIIARKHMTRQMNEGFTSIELYT